MVPPLSQAWCGGWWQRRGEWYADGSRQQKATHEVLDAQLPSPSDRQALDKKKSLARLQTLFQLPGASGEDLGMYVCRASSPSLHSLALPS
jgi:hypothetical protein